MSSFNLVGVNFNRDSDGPSANGDGKAGSEKKEITFSPPKDFSLREVTIERFEALFDFARARFGLDSNGAYGKVDFARNEIAIKLPPNSDLHKGHLDELLEFSQRAFEILGIKDTRPFINYDDRGYPYLRPNLDLTVRTYTDCFDTQTKARNSARFDGLKPRDINIHFHEPEAIANYSTLHLAVIIASYLGERAELPEERKTPVLLLGNAAPRSGSNPNSIGSQFVFAELKHNVYYGGTIEGLSLVKDQIVDDKVLEWNIEVKTTFRSRFLQETAVAWCNRERGNFRGEVPLDYIPEVKNRSEIFSIDNFGNIVTGLTEESEIIKALEIGQNLEVTINGQSRIIRYGRGLGDVEEHGLVMAKGSTTLYPGTSNGHPYYIYQNLGDAKECFYNEKSRKYPEVGSIVTIRPYVGDLRADTNGESAVRQSDLHAA